MNRFIDRLKLFFLGVFVIACVAVWAYQLLWVAPAKHCESQGDWWDPSARVCATPIYLPNLTGRPIAGLTPAQLKARAEAAKAKEAQVLGVTPSSIKPAP
ncbi:MAG TPA: hypothetical protein VMU59_08215 [Caulobacteraceae bacterium]|nr:hypothetical protein [Caulobacteraceae bacterium]